MKIILALLIVFSSITYAQDEIQIPEEIAEQERRIEEEKEARRILIEKRKAIKDRVKAIPYFRSAMRAVLDVANPEAWLRDNIDRDDLEPILVQMEAKGQELKAQSDAEKIKEDKVKEAKQRMKNTNCDDLTGQLQKDICTIIKGQ